MIIWLVPQFSQCSTTLGILILSAIVRGKTSFDGGSLINTTNDLSKVPLLLQILLLATAITALLLAAILRERAWAKKLWLSRQANLALHRQCQQLENQVTEETFLLEKLNQQLQNQVIELQQREQALRETQQRLGAIFDGTFHFMGLLSPTGTVVEANQTLLTSSGIAASEIVGRPFWEARWWKSSTETQEHLKKAIASAANGEFVHHEIDFLGTGEEIVVTLDFSLKPISDETDQVKLLIFEGCEITQHKQAQKKLRESQQRLALVVQQTPLAVIEWDTNFKIVDWNPAAQKIFGYKKSEILGNSAQVLVPTSATDQVNQVLDQLSSITGGTRSTNENLTKDGRTIICDWYNIPLIDPQGQFLGAASMVLDITERQQTQEALLETQERFALAIEANDNGLFDINFNKQERYFSPQFRQMIGYPLDIQGPSLEEIIAVVHPDDRDKVQVSLNGVFDQQKSRWSIEFRLFHTDGSMLWILSRGLVIRDEQGKVARLVGTLTDISDRQRAEVALRSSEEKFRQLAEHIHEVFFLTSPNFSQILYISPAYEEVWGQTTQSLYQQPSLWLDSVHPDDRQRVTMALAPTIRGEQDFEQQYRIIRPDGLGRWVWVRAFRILNETGSLGRIAGIAEDITERKFSETELLRQDLQRQLFADISLEIRQSLELETILQTTVTEVRRILHVDRVLVYQLRADGSGSIVTEAVVPECRSILGEEIYDPCFAKSHLQKYRQRRIRTIDDLEHSQIEICYAQMLRGLDVRANLVVPILQRDVLWGLLIAHQCSSPRQWQNFETGLLCQLADQVGIALSQSQLLEQETQTKQQLAQQNLYLEQTRREAEAANRAKSEFLANMSHELRTPLHGILGYTQILKRELNLSVKQQQGLNIIQRCGEHLLTLLNDILDLSKIEAQKMELQPSDVQLPRFLEDITEIVRIRAEQKNIYFHYQQLSPLPESVRGDEKRLRQVLINLLGNAVKFTNTGGVTFKVGYVDSQQLKQEISETNSESEALRVINPLLSKEKSQPANLRFVVEDTGIGIAPEQLANIFSPFHQIADSSPVVEGTGLGLTISQKLSKLMGGAIKVESNLGKGSVFWLDLDLPAVSQGQVTDVVPERAIIGFQGHKRKVVIADDSWENRSVFVNLLSCVGFEVVEANNGQECLDYARSWQPDLILLDPVMSVINGLEVTRQLRQLPESKDVVILATSASVFDDNQQQCLAAGCDGFISQPVQAEHLFEQLRTELGLKWIYDQEDEVVSKLDENTSVEQNISGAPSCQLTPLYPCTRQFLEGEIIAPPLSEITILYELAMRGDIGGICEQASRLEQLDQQFAPFAQRLSQLAKNFQEKQILELVKKYMVVQE
ncbi:PAS domain S-box protein [Lyngbya aestuarii]|uniref:PAS domain S-box protein n=1 Tax=Lyngbya aestuarii TaxID=118322 RepID=UPI00403D5694